MYLWLVLKFLKLFYYVIFCFCISLRQRKLLFIMSQKDNLHEYKCFNTILNYVLYGSNLYFIITENLFIILRKKYHLIFFVILCLSYIAFFNVIQYFYVYSLRILVLTHLPTHIFNIRLMIHFSYYIQICYSCFS